MRAIAAAVIGLALASIPVPMQAWGLDVHRFLTRRAIDGLPPELRPFFQPHKEFIAEHSIDPDMWRLVDLRGRLGDEPPNHFLDIDGLDDPRPFKNVPRDWDAYIAKYGVERANRMGRVPWRTEEIYQMLVTRFREFGKAPTPFRAHDIQYVVAVLAHYLEDAHVPFHAVLNYDGQLTNQRGIHSRFESELVMRNLTALNLAPVKIQPIPNIKEFVFDRLIEGEALVGSVLAADRKATEGREFYDEAYFATLLAGTRPVVERRMSEAASGVASAIVSAWQDAGKPALPPEIPRPPVRIIR